MATILRYLLFHYGKYKRIKLHLYQVRKKIFRTIAMVLSLKATLQFTVN